MLNKRYKSTVSDYIELLKIHKYYYLADFRHMKCIHITQEWKLCYQIYKVGKTESGLKIVIYSSNSKEYKVWLLVFIKYCEIWLTKLA